MTVVALLVELLSAGWALHERAQGKCAEAFARSSALNAAENAREAKIQQAIAEENAHKAETLRVQAEDAAAIEKKLVERAASAERQAKAEAERASKNADDAKLAELRAKENAEQTERLQYQAYQGIQEALKSTDLEQIKSSLDKILKTGEATKATSNAVAEARDLPSTTFTPVCLLPFKGLRNPAIDDHCGIQGGSSDPAMQLESAAKNNFCATTHDPEVMTYQDFIRLQALAASFPKKLNDRKEVQNLGEGNYVSYVALIMNAHFSNTTGGEAVNCNMSGNAPNGIRIVLIANPSDTDECLSTTAEISPHYRPLNWTPAILNAIGKPVRIRGQLFMDNSHVPCSGNLRPNPKRVSVWEIRPVYSIDVCRMEDLELCRKSTNPADWVAVE